jgi:HAD superfamily hydrolase (TIGR01509 family)
MAAVLFGSISTIADTSELQRVAFNRAFAEHGLDWHWDREEYLSLLESNGGQARIAAYASTRGQTVDAAAVHATKSELFRKALADTPPASRQGVTDTIGRAHQAGVKVGLVTTTAPENVSALLRALPDLQAADFDVVVDSSAGEASKPDPGAYLFALRQLEESAAACIAIEDNLGGVQSAGGAGLRCVAFPNENTASHDFTGAHDRVEVLDPGALLALVVH